MFHFKQFSISDARTAMKVGTDGVLLGAWADPSGMSRIVDAGAGSGLIALMMAQRTAGVTPPVSVTAVELSAGAAADARDNVAASPWEARVKVVEGDCLTFTPQDAGAEGPLMVVSNPPFFAEALRSPDAARALARHGDEFDVVSLIDMAARLGASQLAFIAPTNRDGDVEFRLALRRFSPRRICRVATRAGRPPQRTLWQASVKSGPAVVTDLAIRDTSGALTPEYVALTSAFYLDNPHSL